MKSYDAFAKTMEGVQVKTLSGGIVSVFSVTIMMWLFWTEFYLYINPEISHHMRVDENSEGTTLDITIDLQFPRIACGVVDIDFEDGKGQFQDLTSDQKRLRKTVYHESPESKRKGEYEGCRVAGSAQVNKAAGNIRVSLGRSVDQKHGDHQHHVHQFSLGDMNRYNTTHTVNKLVFGRAFNGQMNPLKEVTKTVVKSTSSQFTYFLKVVPTVQRSGGRVWESYQYSVTEYEKPSELTSFTFAPPGVVFHYDFSPIMVEYEQAGVGFFSFLTNTCAVVGGVFTFASLVDGFIFQSSQALKKQA